MGYLKSKSIAINCNQLFFAESPQNIAFSNYFMAHPQYFDAVTIENRQHAGRWGFLPDGKGNLVSQLRPLEMLSLGKKIAPYLDWVRFLKQNGKRLFFITGEFPQFSDPHSENARRTYLWENLMAGEGMTYSFMSGSYYADADGHLIMPAYDYYKDLKLGRALDLEPILQADGTYIRHFLQGMIWFRPPGVNNPDKRGQATTAITGRIPGRLSSFRIAIEDLVPREFPCKFSSEFALRLYRIRSSFHGE